MWKDYRGKVGIISGEKYIHFYEDLKIQFLDLKRWVMGETFDQLIVIRDGLKKGIFRVHRRGCVGNIFNGEIVSGL